MFAPAKSMFLAALAVASLASASPQPKRQRPFGCAAPHPDSEHWAISEAFEVEELEAFAAGNWSLPRATVNVEVYFHVVAASTDLEDGYVTDQMLSDQIDVLNAAYNPHDIAFTLADTDRTVNAEWANDEAGAELTMKRALRKGDYRSLNIYVMNALVDDAFGYCYLPAAGVAEATSSSAYMLDGCSLEADTLPGGAMTGYNLGQTCTHEVGHWFGLYHTFEGDDCSGTGDLIADTPASASMTEGCPVGRNSCPDQDGEDPIHNYMDYSSDACYEEFTAGQSTRMHSFWNNYRA